MLLGLKADCVFEFIPGNPALCVFTPFAGLALPEPGIGGKESTRDAPKDEEGLNALIPAKPVIWGCSADP